MHTSSATGRRRELANGTVRGNRIDVRQRLPPSVGHAGVAYDARLIAPNDLELGNTREKNRIASATIRA